MNKKIFAYLLLTIISFQLLPLKEVGAIFYGNQMIEEICQGSGDTDGKNAETNEELKKSDIFCQGISLDFPIGSISTVSLHAHSQDYRSRLADDIPTPPPLRFSLS